METRHTFTRADGARITVPHMLASSVALLAKVAVYRRNAARQEPGEAREHQRALALSWADFARLHRIHNATAFRPRLP